MPNAGRGSNASVSAVLTRTPIPIVSTGTRALPAPTRAELVVCSRESVTTAGDIARRSPAASARSVSGRREKRTDMAKSAPNRHAQQRRQRERKAGVFPRFRPLPARNVGNRRHRDAVTDRHGQVNDRKHAARVDSVQRGGAVGIRAHQVDDEKAVRRLRQREQDPRERDGDGERQHRGDVRGKPRAVESDFPLPPRAEEIQDAEIERGGAFAHGDGGRRARRGQREIGQEQADEQQPRAQLYDLLDHLRGRGREHARFSLKIPPETGDRRDEEDGRGERAVGRRGERIPLRVRQKIGKAEQRDAAGDAQQQEQAERCLQQMRSLFLLSPRAALRDELGERRRNADGREIQQNAVHGKDELIEPDSLSAQQIREGNAVKRPDQFG